MYRMIIRKKTMGDQAVTNLYLDIIRSAVLKTGGICGIGGDTKEFDKKKDILIFDECKVAFKYILKGYRNIFIWTQGIVPEEAVMQGKSIYRYWIHSLFEFVVLKRAKLVFLCSDAMKCHYEKKYGIRLSDKCMIMPCFNEQKIDDMSFADKDKHKNSNFLYVGSLNVWQCFEETVSLYKEIELRMNGGSKLFIFTEEKEKAREILSEYNVANYKVEYVSASDLGEKLRNIRYGFVLRKDCIVNNVATPTKISNYLAHGIIPIYSTCLRSFDDFNKKTGRHGIMFDIGDTDVDDLMQEIKREKDTKDIKEWCKNAFETYYSKEKYIDLIVKKINKICP